MTRSSKKPPSSKPASRKPNKLQLRTNAGASSTQFHRMISRPSGVEPVQKAMHLITQEGHPVRHAIPTLFIALLSLAIATRPARAQNTQPTPASTQTQTPPPPRSPGGDVGSGAGDIGKGAAKGTGAAAEGVGKGAGDLVTLHPVNAAGAVGKGAVVTGKDVGVGAAKGTGKIAKGTGRGIGKIFHHGHHDDQDATPPPTPQK